MPTVRRIAACLVAAGIPWVLAAPGASASSWSVATSTGVSAQTQAQALPSPPSGMAASCKSATSSIVVVSWAAVVHASTYTVYESTVSSTSGFASVASGVSGTSWTSSTLNTGGYWFEVSVTVGSHWASAQSTATAKSSVVKNSSCVVA